MEENKKDEDIKQYQENTKMSFFKKVWYSITKIEKYPEMTTLGFASAIKYLILIMVIFSIILSLGLVYKTYTIVNNAVNYFENDFPNVSYKNGTLVVESEEPIKFNDSNSILGNTIIDTNTEDEQIINKYKETINNNDLGIILLKKEMIVKNPTLSGTTTYKYSELLNDVGANVTEFTKQDIIQFAKGGEITSLYTIFFIIIFIYTFIIYLLSTMIDSLILAVLGYLTAIIAKIKMKFVAIYNMAVYSLTLSIILNLIYITVNIFKTFEIKYFQVMYTSVAFIYLAAAIFIIKSEFIKKQMELIKIIEEQKQVKQELKEQKEEESKKENKNSKKDTDDEKENKEDQENNGEEPESSEA